MKKKHSGPQIVAKLRQADVLIGHGKTVPEVCKQIEVSEQTYYRWRQKYGGMSPEMIKQFRHQRIQERYPVRRGYSILFHCWSAGYHRCSVITKTPPDNQDRLTRVTTEGYDL